MNHNSLMDILFVFSKADEIREDPEKREKSVRFAVESIIISAFLAAFLCAGGILMTRGSVGLFIVGIILAVIGLSMFFLALVRVIAQFTINRRAMSWVALVIFLAAIAVPVILVVCLIMFI